MWINTPVDIINNQRIKVIDYKEPFLTSKEVNTTGQEIDMISYENLTSYDSINELTLHNSALILDYQFDFNKITTLRIPNV